MPSEIDDAAPTQAQVPNLVTDPVWSLGMFPVDIDFGGRTFSIPAMPAINWLMHLMGPIAGLYDLAVDIFEELEDHLADNMDTVTFIDLYRTVLDVLGMVSGRPWWVAIRLMRVASDNWHIVGPQLIMAGVDAGRLPLSAWLDCVLYVVINAMDPKEVTMFSLKLEARPDIQLLEPDGEKVDPFDAMVNDEDAFFAMSE